MSVETFVRMFQRQPWMTEGLCKGSSASFFPSETRTNRVSADKYAEAVKVCQSCPVIQECREYGKDERFGVWGGTTPSNRSPRRPARNDRRCGTAAGYSYHRRQGQVVCPECLAAKRLYEAHRKADRRAS
jgi:WhiB family transcriptional regulator, redox-sensing transcriptional regulator